MRDLLYIVKFYLGTPPSCPSSVKCDHECKQTPKGSVCFCKPGYKLQNDNHTCIGKIVINKSDNVAKIIYRSPNDFSISQISTSVKLMAYAIKNV